MTDAPTQSGIPGFKVALAGPYGTGKTEAIRSLIDQGITPFIIFTENGMGILGDIPADKCHWCYIKPAAQDWNTMIDSAKKINTLDFKALTGMAGFNRSKYNQFYRLLEACHNFRCERTGEEFGDISTWNTDRAIVFDSFSGINIMAMDLVVGSKPVKDQKDWGMAIDNLERFIIKITTDPLCHVVMTAHLEREVDQVGGGIKLMFSTLGKKLPPLVGRFFDEVIMTKYSGGNFLWSTADAQADLKNRFLPKKSDLPPSFAGVVEGWKAKGGIICPTNSDGKAV